MKIKIFLISFLIFSCAHPHGKNESNIHMHHQSHEKLIATFDDKSRDEWQKPHEVLKLIGSLKGRQLIDIGAGSGYFTKYFQQAGANVLAADVDEKFLDYIEHSIRGVSLKKIVYDDPMMGKEQFDVAFTSNTYHHIDHRINYLKKVKEGLKPGGRFVVVDFKTQASGKQTFGPPLKMRISIPQVVQELHEAGFEEIIIHSDKLDYQYVIIGIKSNNQPN